MSKPKANDWKARYIEDWNVTTFHAYLIDINKDRSGVDYVPFGKGSINQRWSTEKGQLKQAITKHGNEVVLAFIDLCFETTKVNPEYPTLSFGFMWAYLRDNLSRAELEVKKRKQREETIIEEDETGEDWF